MFHDQYRRLRRATRMLAMLCVACAVTQGAGAAPAPKTLRNLKVAYAAESREQALYLKYAHKADQEGYGVVASLFRAIGRAEEIHATKKAALIVELGGTPVMDDAPLIVRTTRDNLRDAVSAEAFESNILYDGFARRARKEGQFLAMTLFRIESAAEPKHRALFEQALVHLADYQGANTPFPVCPGCGYAARALKTDSCPLCDTPAEEFEWIK